jgi:hypothetical protein
VIDGAGPWRRAGGRLTAVAGGLALCLWLAPQAVAAPIAPTFGAAGGSPVAAGTRPVGLVLGLFTADANLDLAVANEGTGSSNSVATLLSGNGAGGLASPSTTTVGRAPSAIASGLFDAGTTLDLVVANEGSNTVSILRGNGNGTFATATSIGVGDGPLAVAVGDIDNDTRPDIAVANGNDDNVSLLKGNGTGGFSSLSSVSAGNKPAAVALARINGDANLDLLVANESADTVTLRLGNGNGTFGSASTITVGDKPNGIATGDLNLNGTTDVVVTNSGSNTVSILLGNGAGTLTAQPSPPSTGAGSTPVDIAIADLNGDADPDLVTANSGAARASVLPGNGDGTFATRVDLTTGSGPMGIATGDLNGDARTDILIANRTANTVTVMLNTTPATVSVAAPATLSFGAATVGATLGPIAQSVTVVSNARGGYQLSASRSVFTRGDLPLGVSAASAPAGALLDLAAGTSSIPTSGSRNIGRRSLTVTRSAGDVWSLGLSLGPVPLVADGAHTSTLTYTVVGLP